MPTDVSEGFDVGGDDSVDLAACSEASSYTNREEPPQAGSQGSSALVFVGVFISSAFVGEAHADPQSSSPSLLAPTSEGPSTLVSQSSAAFAAWTTLLAPNFLGFEPGLVTLSLRAPDATVTGAIDGSDKEANSGAGAVAGPSEGGLLVAGTGVVTRPFEVGVADGDPFSTAAILGGADKIGGEARGLMDGFDAAEESSPNAKAGLGGLLRDASKSAQALLKPLPPLDAVGVGFGVTTGVRGLRGLAAGVKLGSGAG